MTELLLGNDVEGNSSLLDEFLAEAKIAGRFEWRENCGTHARENCGTHALIYTASPRGRLYEIKLGSALSPAFLRFPSAGNQIDIQKYDQHARFEIPHDSVEHMKEASLADLVAKLPSLETIRGKDPVFEMGLAYHIGKRLVSEVSLYFRRQ